ncbi:hypothetical protein [Vibrio coralliilyticus]|uniref:hypothetical protein n=1 Tax=Vibrio coralliilyticus TaxID=190893 RepID=UPI000C1706CB|nr:hypothetical protein [Vibrio coralliilyticus]
MPTLYDKLITKAKNNKFIVLGMITVIAITSILPLIDSAVRFFKTIFPSDYVQSPIRMSFHYVRGHGLSLMLDGSLDNSLQDHLGGKPLIWKNQIYSKLSSLHKSYSRTIHVGDGYAVDENYKYLDNVLDKKLLPSTFYFYKDHSYEWRNGNIVQPWYGTDKVEFDGFPSDLSIGWSMSLTRNPNDENSAAKVKDYLSKGIVPAENVRFYRYLKRNEVKGMFGIDDRFYQDITRISYPDNFFKAELSFDSCGEGWKLDLRTPLLVIQILAIENITDKPITIDKILGELSESKGILDENNLKPFVKFESKLGDGVLKPKERLIIPINLIYEFKKDSISASEDADWATHLDIPVEEVNKLIYKFDSIVIAPTSLWLEASCEEIANCNSDVKIRMPKKSVINALSLPVNKDTGRYYLSSMKISNFLINGRTQEIRPVPKTSIFISHGSESGSCPYLFSNDDPIGKFLTGRDSKDQEGIYSKKLQDFSNEFTIKELEKEITYIQWARLVCESKDGSIDYIDPIDSILNKVNSDYLVLVQGDSFDIHFPAVESGYNNCSFQASGYYDPLEASNN